MAAPGWLIENYNAFLREARDEFGIGFEEARSLYREVRDWKTAPAYGADVDRYSEALRDDPELVTDSILFGAPGMLAPVVPVFEGGDYDDDFYLDVGAELELTAKTYKEKT